MLTLVYPIGTKPHFFDAANAAPQPWPTQTAVTVAQAIIHDTPTIYPSRTFRTFLCVDRYLPFMRRIEQRLEKRRFDAWLMQQA